MEEVRVEEGNERGRDGTRHGRDVRECCKRVEEGGRKGATERGRRAREGGKRQGR